MVLANLWHFIAYMVFAKHSWDDVPKFELIPWKADGKIKKFDLKLMICYSVDMDESHEEQKRKHKEIHEEHLKKPWYDPRRWIAIAFDCYEGINNMLFSSSNDNNTESLPSNIPLSPIEEEMKKDEKLNKETSITSVERGKMEINQEKQNSPLKLLSFDGTKAEFEFA